MNNTIQSLDNSLQLGVKYFLLASSLYVVFYFFSESKLNYAFVSICLYIASYVFRHNIIKTNDNQYSEIGLFFMSFLLTAYLLYFFNIDTNINNYLPQNLLVQFGAIFIFITTLTFFSNMLSVNHKYLLIIILVLALFTLQIYKNDINEIFLDNLIISKIVIGTPIFYLFFVLFGLKTITK